MAIASAEEATDAAPPIPEITSPMFLILIGVISVVCLLPFFVVFLALRDREKWKDYPLAMPKGSVRALLAFSLVVVIVIMLVLFRCFNEIISALLAILASIVGYYFGQRSVGGEHKEENGAESKEAINPQVSPKTENTTSAEQKFKFLQKLMELIKSVIEGIFKWREKQKTSEDIEQLHQRIERLSTDVDKRTKEFAEFKAEVSDRLDKLEENMGAMIEDRKAPENKKL